jgi:hypothetical protein
MAGLCLWVTTSRGRSAQDGPTRAASASSPFDAPGQNKTVEKKEGSPAASIRDSGAAESAPLEPAAADTEVPSSAPGVPTTDLAPSSRSSEQPFRTDDPEKAADAFAEQNRKVAETQLKTLTDEANRLRARLRQVEAGIKRWQALVEAMKQTESPPVVGAPSRRARDQDSDELEPVPPTAKPRSAARPERDVLPAQPPDEPPGALREDAPKPR